MPKGACSCRVSRAVNGAMVEVSGKNNNSGLAGFAWVQSSDVFIFDGGRRVTDREPLRGMSEFLMPIGACSSRVSRAVNGAMVEVSGKTQHSGLAGFAWEQGPEISSFDG